MNAHTRAEALRLLDEMDKQDALEDASARTAYYEASDKLRALLSASDDVADRTWRCTQCGESLDYNDTAWRWTGFIWQHHHADAGHVDARLFSSAVATVPDSSEWPSVHDLTPARERDDPQFSAWRNRMPDKHWARYDLSAVRLGFELGRAVFASPPPPNGETK